MIRLGKHEGTLLLSFLLLFCFALLYVFRSFDTNTLVSWRWVFNGQGFSVVLPFLLAAIVTSLAFSLYFPLEKYPVPLLTFTAGTSVVFLWSAPELILDSGRYFLQAKYLSEYGILYFLQEWGQTITAWTDMPLMPFLYGLILRYGDELRVVVQLFNSFLFILTVITTYKIGGLLWNRELGFYAGLLLLGIPYLLTQVPQMLVDVPAMFFHLLAVYCFLKAVTSSDRLTIIFASAAIVFTVFVKFSTWPLLSLLPVTAIVLYLQDRNQKILQRTACILFFAVLVSTILISFKIDVFSEQLKILLGYQRPALKLWGEGILSSFIFQFHPFISMLVCLACFMAYRHRDKLFLIVLFYCLLIALLQIERIRYMIPLMPFITLMGAYGIVSFRETELRRLTGCMVVTSSLVILFVVYLPFFQTTSMMNIKLAGKALDQLESETVEVIVLPQEKSEGSSFIAIPILDMFTGKKIVSRQKWPHTQPDHLSPFSPLLYTWKLTKPPYYTLKNEQLERPLVIIASVPAGQDGLDYLNRYTSPPDGIHFTRNTGVFRYRTFVSIYNVPSLNKSPVSPPH